MITKISKQQLDDMLKGKYSGYAKLLAGNLESVPERRTISHGQCVCEKEEFFTIVITLAKMYYPNETTTNEISKFHDKCI